MTQDTRRQEIDKNLEAFNKKLTEFIRNHSGKYALLKNEEIRGIYDTAHDAQITGQNFLEDDLFSIQKNIASIHRSGILLTCRASGVDTIIKNIYANH